MGLKLASMLFLASGGSEWLFHRSWSFLGPSEWGLGSVGGAAAQTGLLGGAVNISFSFLILRFSISLWVSFDKLHSSGKFVDFLKKNQICWPYVVPSVSCPFNIWSICSDAPSFIYDFGNCYLYFYLWAGLLQFCSLDLCRFLPTVYWFLLLVILLSLIYCMYNLLSFFWLLDVAALVIHLILCLFCLIFSCQSILNLFLHHCCTI